MIPTTHTPPQYFDIFDSPVGEIIVVVDEFGLRHVDFQQCPRPLLIDPTWLRNANACREARQQLQGYFAKELRQFDLPLAPRGTDFQQVVWRELANVGFGSLSTYGQMAKNLNRPTASRAIGMANGRNPLSIVLPCHRIVGANKKLTGYRGGLDIKTFLLKHEGFEIENQTLMV